MRLLAATKNRNKLQEMRAILHHLGVELIGTDDIPGLPDDVPEDGTTFRENALLKAQAYSMASKLWALADDSGLEVDALDGAPGVHSARYAGEPCNNEANNRLLLRNLTDIADRTARFRCAIALATPDGRSWCVEGRCEGTIATTPAGGGGFGYDPLFIPQGYTQTFAELPAALKNTISHRAAALAEALQQWYVLLG